MSEDKDKTPYMDWQQVVLNGGPPCFALNIDHTIPNKYCGRAELWGGHGEQKQYGHEFVSLNDLLATVRREARVEAFRKLIGIINNNFSREMRKVDVLAALERAADSNEN